MEGCAVTLTRAEFFAKDNRVAVSHGTREIDGIVFESIKEAKDVISLIIDECIANRRAEEDHQKFLLALVSMHPNFESMLVDDVDWQVHIATNRVVWFRQYERVVRRFEGRTYQRQEAGPFAISINDCLSSQSHAARVAGVARRNVAPYRDQREHPPHCASCGYPIEVGDVHYDHYPYSFASILDEWRYHEDANYQDIAISQGNFADSNLRRRWINFHEYYAKLRPTHSRCNLTNKDRDTFEVEYFDFLQASSTPPPTPFHWIPASKRL